MESLCQKLWKWFFAFLFLTFHLPIFSLAILILLISQDFRFLSILSSLASLIWTPNALRSWSCGISSSVAFADESSQILIQSGWSFPLHSILWLTFSPTFPLSLCLPLSVSLSTFEPLLLTRFLAICSKHSAFWAANTVALSFVTTLPATLPKSLIRHQQSPTSVHLILDFPNFTIDLLPRMFKSSWFNRTRLVLGSGCCLSVIAFRHKNS